MSSQQNHSKQSKSRWRRRLNLVYLYSTLAAISWLGHYAISEFIFRNRRKEVDASLRLVERSLTGVIAYRGNAIMYHGALPKGYPQDYLERINTAQNDLFGARSVATIIVESFGPPDRASTYQKISQALTERYLLTPDERIKLEDMLANTAYQQRKKLPPAGEQNATRLALAGSELNLILIYEPQVLSNDTAPQLVIQTFYAGKPLLLQSAKLPEASNFMVQINTRTAQQTAYHEMSHVIQRQAGLLELPTTEQGAEIGGFMLPLYLAAKQYGVDSAEFATEFKSSRQIWAWRNIVFTLAGSYADPIARQTYCTPYSGAALFLTNDGELAKFLCQMAVVNNLNFTDFFVGHLQPIIEQHATSIPDLKKIFASTDMNLGVTNAIVGNKQQSELQKEFPELMIDISHFTPAIYELSDWAKKRSDNEALSSGEKQYWSIIVQCSSLLSLPKVDFAVEQERLLTDLRQRLPTEIAARDKLPKVEVNIRER